MSIGKLSVLGYLHPLAVKGFEMIEELCDYVLKVEEKLFRGKIAMTIIIAMKESDEALLIGADKLGIEGDILKVGSSVKLFKHPKDNMVWGFTPVG